MQDCCRTAPRGARYGVIAIVVGFAALTALLARGGAESPPPRVPASTVEAPSAARR